MIIDRHTYIITYIQHKTNIYKFSWLLHPHRQGQYINSKTCQTIKHQTKTQRIKMMESLTHKKPTFLCLHGFRTSAEIMKKQIGRWPESVLDRLTLDFLDGPDLASGKSGFEAIYNPPYYEWFHTNKDFSEIHHFEECVAYIEDYMIKHGPFDGLLGFSQGGMLSVALLGMQMHGVAFTKVPKIKCAIIISGFKFPETKFGQPKLSANAYSSQFICPTLHFIGEKDFLRKQNNELLEFFEHPFVIHHSEGHTIPRLEGKGLETMLKFIEKIEKLLRKNPISASL